MSEMKKWKKCPECGKRATVDYSRGAPVAGKPTLARDHKNKSDTGTWYQDEVDNTKEALDYESGVSPYSRMSIDTKHWVKKGVARTVTGKEAERVKSERADAVRRAGENLSESEKDFATKEHRRYSK